MVALAGHYETGAGVQRDFKRAAALYEQASRFSPGTTYVYLAPVGKSGRGQVAPVRVGPDRPGLPEAQYRLGLMYLEGRGVRFDFPKGRAKIEAAAAQGYPPAQLKLQQLRRLPRL